MARCSNLPTMWAEAQEALNSLLQREIEDKPPKVQKDRITVFQTLATFYIKYVQIFCNLETAYDQIVHPQKRLVIRQVLEGVMGRILELKNEMVEVENSEFHYFDDILQDLKLSPEHIEIPIPRYFIKEKLKVLREREKILAQILINAGLQDIKPKTYVKPLPLEEVFRVIQISERARQGRLRATFMKQIYLEEKRERQARLQGAKGPNVDAAAIRIQKVWRGFTQWKKTVKMREEEMIFLGMVSFFPDYPNEEEGGSTAIFSQKNPDQVAAELAAKEEEAALKKKTKEKGKKEKEKKKKGKGKGKGKEKKGKTDTLPWFFQQLLENQYIWQNRDERWNFPQEYDPELIKEEKRKEVEEEIRVQVDELMRQELKNLKLAVDKEKEKKQKKGKKGKKGGKKVSAARDGKPACITILYPLNTKEEILPPLKPIAKLPLSEYSYLGTTLRQVDIEPMPSLTDVRQLIALYGILPLGSQAVHEKAPLVKALLLAGPTGVGKKMLVHALCTETGANLFNLSASNIAGKYPGKSGLQMMLHMVFKVAKQLQPSVIWIGDSEKTFYKRVPKSEKEMEPKRLKKNLPKILKSLKAEDRVLVVGTTKRPFDADLRPFCKVYKKIILIPRPDYASRFVLWKHIVLQNGGAVTKSLNISCLAKVSDGFTQGHIVCAVQTVLSERRLRQMTNKPLTAAEFLTSLARQDPVYKEEEETYKVKLTSM
uniref:IQ motif containing with AAA domain 1 n=1 Tax=Chelydra serpentina TaxID=8475 RepID=A0A8C3S8L3_CHESE